MNLEFRCFKKIAILYLSYNIKTCLLGRFKKDRQPIRSVYYPSNNIRIRCRDGIERAMGETDEDNDTKRIVSKERQ